MFVDGVRQDPSTYSVSGGNIVFNTPPAGQFISAFGDDREFADSGQTLFDAQGGQTLTRDGVSIFISGKHRAIINS